MFQTSDGNFRIGTTLEAINQSQTRFLAYSFLYYHCDISLIPDSHYDSICRWLFLDKINNQAEFESSQYYELCKELDESGSGFYLSESDYPEKIKQVCVRLLTQCGKEIPIKLL